MPGKETPKAPEHVMVSRLKALLVRLYVDLLGKPTVSVL